MFGHTSHFLSPIHYFSLGCDCHHLGEKKSPFHEEHLLPTTEALTNEKNFAKVYFAWSERGLHFHFSVSSTTLYPFNDSIEEGEAVELFIDTRDIKTSGFNTRFCHHFFFLPASGSTQLKGEITRFRNEEDAHPLSPAESLFCETKKSKNGYEMEIFIPIESLTGFEPYQFDRLGFTYRIRTASGKLQHFSASSEDYPIHEQPALWSSLTLRKKKESCDEKRN